MSKKKKKTNKKVQKKNTQKKVVKKNVNKEFEEKNKKKGKIDEDILKLIKLVIGISLVVAVVYVLTYFMDKVGVFDEGYTRSERSEAIISYENSLVGTIFNKAESTYYVVFDEFTENANQYLYSVLYRYNSLENVTPIYSVDMSNGFNKEYAGNKSNPSAQRVIDIKISGPTLIKISNGRNVRYIEGVENIEKELLK